MTLRTVYQCNALPGAPRTNTMLIQHITKQRWLANITRIALPFFRRDGGGMWSENEDNEGQAFITFAIITTAAKSLVSQVHDRVPVLLRSDDT